MKPADLRLCDQPDATGFSDTGAVLSAHGAGDLGATLVELTSTAIRVRLPASAQALLGSGGLSVALQSGDQEACLGDVEVTATQPQDSEMVVSLEPADAAGRARLWELWDKARAGAITAGRGHSDCGGVPGRGHYTESARQQRLRWIRSASSAPLGTLDQIGLDATRLRGNIENLVASVEIPVGLAGPLLFDGSSVQGQITAPLATTEGALVASATRGARAITRGGGVRTQVLGQRMSRAPLYEFDDVRAAARFGRWIESHLAQIREQVATVSGHAHLVEVWPLQIGRVVHVRFSYETADAAGQNMTTACTWQACRWINEQLSLLSGLQPRQALIEGYSSGDKKVNYLSLLAGRGTRVTAECFLDRRTVEAVLKTTPQALAEGFHRGVLSAAHTGMIGTSINAANLVAAIFTATGQDIGCVHESSVAFFSVDAIEDGLYASTLLPALIVGTVGGGTSLPNQRNFLEMIGCAGSGRIERFAEIVAGFALALDLSTMAAVIGGQFANAHERLGRNRPVEWLTREDLRPEFFTPMLAEALGDPALQVLEVANLPPVEGSSIITEITGQNVGDKLTGLLRLRLRYAVASGEKTLAVVAKVKPLDAEVILTSNKIASLCGGRLAEIYPRWRDWTGFKDAHTRELGIYRFDDERLRAVMPRLYGTYEDERREAYVIVMEDLTGNVVLNDSVANRAAWSERHVDAALRGIAGAHAVWLGRTEEAADQPWLGRRLTAREMSAMQELWRALAEHNAAEYPDWIDDFTLLRIQKSIGEIPEWWPELEAMPNTVVHNDFNPRNVALRTGGGELVAYDWELATIHVPQRDLAEFLAFTMPADVQPDRVEHHVEQHRTALERAAGVQLDPRLWRRGYRLALRDFTLTRLQLYMMAHTQCHYEFLEELVEAIKRLIRIEGEHEIAGGRYGDPTLVSPL
jgi:hydroxymethylglutaryl-CoA reductase (NADPH)